MTTIRRAQAFALAGAIAVLIPAAGRGYGDDAAESAHAAHHEAAQHVPDSISEIWSAIDSEMARLELTVARGELSTVHGIAFEIRDLVRALPGQSGTLPDAKQKLLAGLITRVDEHAANLDRYGDADDVQNTTRELGELNNRLDHIRKLYPETPAAQPTAAPDPGPPGTVVGEAGQAD